MAGWSGKRVTGDLDALQGLLHHAADLLVADTVHPSLARGLDGSFVLQLRPGLGEPLIGFGHQAGVMLQALLGLPGGEPAGGAGRADLVAWVVLLRQDGWIPRRCEAFRLKRFDAPWSDQVIDRVCGVEPKDDTRTGGRSGIWPGGSPRWTCVRRS
jgi:hypothetical protein